MTVPTLLPDAPGSASHQNLRDHLSGPLAGGAMVVAVPIAATARATVDWAAREPLLLATLTTSVDRGTLRLEATLDPDGAATPLPPLTWDPYSEAGATLALWRPPLGAGVRTAAPFTVALQVFRDGDAAPLPAAEVADAVGLSLVEGQLGRLLYLLTAEKQRLRRTGREVTAMRALATARDEALDRIGQGLSVGRFAETLAWQAGEIVTPTAREPDADYRRRLELYRPFLVPTRRQALDLLNGPVVAGVQRDGPLQAMGLAARFTLAEADNPFAVAVHLVASAPTTPRANALRQHFLAHLRDARLIDATHAVPAGRLLPSSQRAEQDALRAALRAGYVFPHSNRDLAPLLAMTLERVRRALTALGVTAKLHLRNGQSDAGGSRYELGLGIDLQDLTAARRKTLYEHARDGVFAHPPDAEVQALIAAMAPRPPAEDPDSRWFFEACGLATVHRLDAGWLYVSHFPTFGLRVFGPSLTMGGEVELQAHYAASNDSALHVVLEEGLAAAAAAWAGPAWTRVGGAAAQQAAWAHAAPPSAAAEAVLRAADLPVVADLARFRQALARLPEALYTTLALAPAQAVAILGGDVAAIAPLTALRALLVAHDAAAVVPLVSATGDVWLVVSIIGLPQVGSNLSGRRAAGFRWYAVPITGDGGTVQPLGSRSRFRPRGTGLTALVCVGYARRGATDPYEVRPELPADARLDLLQYEYLMNLLERFHPLGIEVNTWSIRQTHVDLDGDGAAEPLSPSAARTYRPYRRPRHRAAPAVTLDR